MDLRGRDHGGDVDALVDPVRVLGPCSETHGRDTLVKEELSRPSSPSSARDPVRHPRARSGCPPGSSRGGWRAAISVPAQANPSYRTAWRMLGEERVGAGRACDCRLDLCLEPGDLLAGKQREPARERALRRHGRGPVAPPEDADVEVDRMVELSYGGGGLRFSSSSSRRSAATTGKEASIALAPSWASPACAGRPETET